MYQAFNFTVNDESLAAYPESPVSIVSEFKVQSRESLLANLKNGVLDAAALEKDWFGEVEADVFISHSHADLDLANKVALILENELGLKSFVDSHVWGYADDLLNIIDKEFCWKESRKMFDYQSRNRSTSNVHLMLSTALTKMIDKCEVVLFLNTENSISSENYVKEGEETTGSPWIYSELITTKFLRKEKRNRVGNENYSTKGAMDSVLAKSFPRVSYKAHLSHLTPMDAEDFHKWCGQGRMGNAALDFLYDYLPDVGNR
ncbi:MULTISPECIES: hypothetical protein [unclassified Duganella]|jgi:hypothetical protein|uniref:hypothetical protein n=1 Tax=unclassified Duganella TaxID=2636909 RepID=UPI0008809E20|nr:MULTISPECIES: hypothetical protein [unclassified Duganella]SDG83364.1 hypothetical protein SAMN05216320_107230 [Duganella sp. OV458]SDK10754.1 hypothetical protein SAMN05428973_108230 [Duganella sp. OV510]